MRQLFHLLRMPFLQSLHYFRALSIVLIVASHTYWLAELPVDRFNFAERVAGNLISGCTALFVFISGYLFGHIFVPRYNYRKFFESKVRNLLVPYLILSTIPVWNLVSSTDPGWGGRFLPDGEGFVATWVEPWLHYLWTGRFKHAFWYIPFIMTMFAMSPLHYRIWFWPARVQWTLVGVLLAVALLVHRPVDNIGVLQSVAYFLPVYLFGMLCCRHRETLFRLLSGRERLLLGAALGLAVLQSYQHIYWIGNFSKPPWQFNGIDISLPQKLCLSLFFLIWLSRFEQTRNRAIELLAEGSFAIYLLHIFVLGWFHWINARYDLPDGWLAFFGLVAAVIAVCLAIGALLRKLLGRYSRYLTGW